MLILNLRKISMFILCALIFYTEFYQISVKSVEGFLVIIGLVLVSVFFLYIITTKTYLKELFPSEIILLIAFFVWTFVSGVFVTPNTYLFFDLETFVGEATIICIIIMLLVKRSPANASSIMLILILTAIANVLNLFVNGIQTISNYQRITLGSINANDIANSFNISLVATMYYLNRVSKSKKIFLVLLSVLLLFGIVLTGSRKSIIGFYMLLIMYVFVYYIVGTKTKKVSAIRAVLVLMITGMVVIASANYILNNTVVGIRLFEEENIKRTMYYQNAFAIFLDNPITGIGINGFRYFNGVYSHSTYAELLSCTGIIGTLLYTAIYIVMYKKLTFIIKNTHDPKVEIDAKLFKIAIILLAFIGITMVHVYKMYSYVLIGCISGFIAQNNMDINYADKKFRSGAR